MPCTRAASFALSCGTKTVVIPCSFNPITRGKTPFTFLKDPSKDNSPRNAILRSSGIFIPCSFNIPIAIGKSKLVPSFLMSAGARLTITLPVGNVKPEFLIAEWTLSRASLIELSGNPTMLILGREFVVSTSTSILYALIPTVAAVIAFVTIKWLYYKTW